MILLQREDDDAEAYLPCRVDTAGLGHVQPGLAVMRVKANNEGRNTERTDTTGLGVSLYMSASTGLMRAMPKVAHLLNTGNVLGDVFDADGVLDGQTMGLAFDTGFVDEDTSVGSETSLVSFRPVYSCSSGGTQLTGKGDTDVVIQHSHLPHCPRVLQLQS